MKENNRIFLFISNVIVMVTGFLLPIYISRVIPEYSDSAFFYLSLLNPIIIFFGFDQRKQIILGSTEDTYFHSKVRFNFVLTILLISIILLFNFNSFFFLPILLIKMISFSMDMHNGILQNDKKFLYLCFLRIVELLLMLSIIFVNPDSSIPFLILYLVFLMYKWIGSLDKQVWVFIKKKYSLGFQGTITATSSALGVYILKLSGNDYLITDLAIQATILSAMYMSQSIYLNSIMDKFKLIGNIKTINKLFFINMFFVLASLITFILFHFFNLFKIVFDTEVELNFLSLYAFLFMIIHMFKNSQFIYSFLIKKSIAISKFKIIMGLFYFIPLVLPIDFMLKLLLVLIFSLSEFFLVFKLIKK